MNTSFGSYQRVSRRSDVLIFQDSDSERCPRSGSLCAEAGQGLPPFPAPLSPLAASFLRCAPDKFLLTKPNTSCTIEVPASLRSDGVRVHPGMPFGIIADLAFGFAGIPTNFGVELDPRVFGHKISVFSVDRTPLLTAPSNARNRAISDAVLVSGDEGLRVDVQRAQEFAAGPSGVVTDVGRSVATRQEQRTPKASIPALRVRASCWHRSRQGCKRRSRLPRRR